jgi:hypothetical protein
MIDASASPCFWIDAALPSASDISLCRSAAARVSMR